MENGRSILYGLVTSTLLAVLFIITLMVTSAAETESSELYFEEPESLPTVIHLGEDFSFSFTLANKGEDTEAYTYSVYKDLGLGQELVMAGSITLHDDEQATIPVTFAVEENVTSGRIYIVVDDKQIYFSMIGA